MCTSDLPSRPESTELDDGQMQLFRGAAFPDRLSRSEDHHEDKTAVGRLCSGPREETHLDLPDGIRTQAEATEQASQPEYSDPKTESPMQHWPPDPVIELRLRWVRANLCDRVKRWQSG